MTPSLIELSHVSKSYGALRPLRIERLSLSHGEAVALLGFDRPMAEVFINLVTGAALPEHGDVTLFGQPTSTIADSGEWLRLVDRFGIVSDRSVMLDGMTAIQNLAMSFTLDVEPPADAVRRAAEKLAQEVGLPQQEWNTQVGRLDGFGRALVRVARALALEPAVLLLEHPTASLAPDRVLDLAARIRQVTEQRAVAALAVTADQTFAARFGARALRLDPATGRLIEHRARGWFGRPSR